MLPLPELHAHPLLDLLLAKARLARRFGCVRPEIDPQGRVEASDMIHPEVADHLRARGGAFTPVSLMLERGTTVITGANMGGKSVSLKSTTLNLLLAPLRWASPPALPAPLNPPTPARTAPPSAPCW